MLQVARLSPNLLGDSCDLIRQFLTSQQIPGGGFADRSGNSDLYYTVFGLESFLALRDDPPVSETAAWLRSFGGGDGLDFVHLACLGRCWATVARGDFRETPREAILERLERFRSRDGGYAQACGAATGTVYAAFLALAAYEDFHVAMPEPDGLLCSLESLRAADGAYSNHAGAPRGITTSTAAAVLLLRHLGETPDGAVADWLLARAHPQGGFFALPDAPIPDLLSTATALHALSAMQVPFESIRESCLDFIDSLWTNRGGFYGSWADDKIDCEYTYYALLSLGHLSL
jgi:prenyltransferase beta subunit